MGDPASSVDDDGDGVPDECQLPESDCNPLVFNEDNVSNSGASSTLPRAFASGGRIYLAWKEGTFLRTRVATEQSDGTLFYDTAVTVDSSGSYNVGTELAIGARGDNVYVAWLVGSASLAFARSTDGGATYDSPQILFSNVNAIPQRLNLFVTETGRIYVAYTERNLRFRISVSEDEGLTFLRWGTFHTRSYNAALAGEQLHAVLTDSLVRFVTFGPDASGTVRFLTRSLTTRRDLREQSAHLQPARSGDSLPGLGHCGRRREICTVPTAPMAETHSLETSSSINRAARVTISVASA